MRHDQNVTSLACRDTDLVSGVYHWAVDNYGDGATPVFGSQIAGFQALQYIT